jgi:hypothetical protein
MLGLLALTFPYLPPMKLSKLRSLCDKAIEKYGDVNVGSYSKDYAYDIEQEADMHDFCLRIISAGGGLPGETLCEEDETQEESDQRFACIFYKD